MEIGPLIIIHFPNDAVSGRRPQPSNRRKHLQKMCQHPGGHCPAPPRISRVRSIPASHQLQQNRPLRLGAKNSLDVPSDFEEDHIPIPVNRAGKRITLVGCSCLDGTVRKSIVVIPRHTVGNDLSYWGCQIRIVTSAISRTGLSPRTFRDMDLGNFLQELKCKSHRILRASNFDHLRLHCPRCGLLL
jgi:hypothetical protein